MPRPTSGTSARRPTLADVGRLAGVSPTAVSFVINGRAAGEVNAETRSRVLDAVEQLGYRPNRLARNLRTKRTETIGFVTDEIAVERAGGRTISGAHDVALRNDTLLFVVNATRDARLLEAAVHDLLDRQVDAIVFAVIGTRLASLPDAVRQVPTVLVNCFPPGGSLPCVLPDEAEGGRRATELLLRAGHRRIAYVAGLPGSWATRRRLKGHRQALLAAGIPPDPNLVLSGNFRADSGFDRTQELLTRRDRPTAILYGNDRMAMGGYLALGQAGLRIPADMSVVGYDDQDDIAPEIRPPLTTIHLPYYEMGRWAVEQLVERRVEELPARTYVPCPPVPRSSVGPPRADADATPGCCPRGWG